MIAFASTNVDDAVLLLGLFASPRFRVRDIVLGQFLGMTAIVGLSLGAAFLALALSPRILALLGVAPLLMGALQLWDAWRPRDGDLVVSARGGASALAVAAVTAANGGDNIALYAPLFAGRGAGDIVVICAVFAALLALWCAGARRLVGHGALRAGLIAWGSRLAPFVLIALGVLILARGGAHGPLIQPGV